VAVVATNQLCHNATKQTRYKVIHINQNSKSDAVGTLEVMITTVRNVMP